MVLTPRPTLTSNSNYPDNEKDGSILDARGVADERAWYYNSTALLRHARGVAVEEAMSKTKCDDPMVAGKASTRDVIG